MSQVALTTIDNPYNPFTRFDEWNAYDMDQGHGTCAYLARVTRSSDELSITDQDLALEYAMNDIIDEDVLGIYIKVTPNHYETQKVSES
jgi:hypothetical protein